MPGTTTICAIFAHPDDEAFGVAGTLAFYASEGVRTALICVTHGEAGMSNGLASTHAALARVRAGELACAAQAIGLADLEVLDFPDGGGDGWDEAELASRVEDLLRRIRPEVVITFDRDGITRHPDHMALHRVVSRLMATRGNDLGVCRLFYQVVTCPEDASPEGPSLACVSLDEVDITVNIREFERTKRAALRCHRTQAADTADILNRPEASLVSEQYRLAWAADGWRPSGTAADLLAGLATGKARMA